MLSLTREGCGSLHIIVYVTSLPVSIFISSSTIKTVLYVLVCSVLRHFCEPTRHNRSFIGRCHVEARSFIEQNFLILY